MMPSETCAVMIVPVPVMSCILCTLDMSNTCATWSGTISLHWCT